MDWMTAAGRAERRQCLSLTVIVAASALQLVGCRDDPADVAPSSNKPPAKGTAAASRAFTTACRRAADDVAVVVLCPERLPKGGFEAPQPYGDPPCTYLLNLEPRGAGRRAGSIFHLLLGGTCRPWVLSSVRGRWPASLVIAPDTDLRLVGTTSLDPARPGVAQRRVRLRVVRRTRVGTASALVLRNPPYPVGGIHGGHLTVIWNEGQAGYALSGHPVGLHSARSASARNALAARAITTLVAVAASMRPASP